MRHFSSAIVVHEQSLGPQPLVQNHGLKLTLTQTGNGNDEFLKIDLDYSSPEIRFQPPCLGLVGHGAFSENRPGHAHIREETIEKS